MKKFIVTVMVFSLFASFSFSQEGMWLLSQIDQLDLEEQGLEISSKDIYDPGKVTLNQAIVQLGGGTASFVSPDGLLITNHHVAFGALQRTSSVSSNYISEGFLARERTEEIHAPGYRALLMLEMEDVTEEVLKAAKGIDDPTERDEKINEKITKMTQAVEKGKKDIMARVAENYNGRQYILYTYKEFNDIRIVYSPPLSIGNYGGDIDNWMWPRHTGDFSFMRVYVSPEGYGAEYSEENVPYHPEVWLKVAQGDLDEGDFAFIIGYPGSTTRFRTSNSADWNLNINYPFSIESFQNIINILEETTADNPEGQIKVAALHSGLNNVMKNYQGKVEGMQKTNFVDKKRQFEKEFTAWVNEDPERQSKYGHILKDIKKNYDKLATTKQRDNVFGIVQGLSGTMMNLAATIYINAWERNKPKKEREPWATDENLEETINNLHFQYANYFESTDKAMLAYVMELADKLPEGQRIEPLDVILNDDSKAIDQWVEETYEKSGLDDADYAKSLLRLSYKELMEEKDPFIDLVASLYDLNEEIDQINGTFAANVTDLRKEYINALYEWKGSNLYPDANSTIRFTYGKVKGYEPKDAVWYKPFTTLKGVIEKNTGEAPFNVSEDLIKLYKKKDFGGWEDPDLEDMTVAFTHMADITGGNSGSPVMNARGEIIGVAFDGNYEAMISDWQYDYDLQRTISVDIRYVMFITEKFSEAGFLLEEMGVR